jgi:hypothetical protein
MSRSVSVEVSEEVYAELSRRAAEDGLSVAQLLGDAAARLAMEPAIPRVGLKEWLERTRGISSDLRREEILESLDEIRGPWPEPEQ